MLAWAKLLLVAILAFSPFAECFDEYEQPWTTDPSREAVATVISCALVLGYACVRRQIPLLRTVARRARIVVSPSTILHGMFVCQQALPHSNPASGFTPPPLRI